MMTTAITTSKALGLTLMVTFNLLGFGIAQQQQQQQQVHRRQTDQKQNNRRRVATGSINHEGRQRRSSSLSSLLPIFEIEEDHTPFYEHNELEIELGMILTEDMHHWERVLQQQESLSM